MKILRIQFYLALAIFSGAVDVTADPLSTAKSLADSRFKGWSYGSKVQDKQIDCVQFVLAVAEECLVKTFAAETRNAVLINHGWTAEETQAMAEEGRDRRLSGIQYALADLDGSGTKIAAEEVKVGDFIQYWMKKSDGTWFGHSGVVSSVEGARVKIFGAHASMNRIGESTFKLNLLCPDRHIYLLRIDNP